MPTKFWIALLPIALALSGCQTDAPSPVIDMAPLSDQIGNLAQANADLRAANERLQAANAVLQAENDHLKAVLRADTDAGTAANAQGALRFEGFVWKHQATLLPYAPDKKTADDWNQAWSYFSSGNESALQGVIGKLQTDAGTLNTELGSAREALRKATEERDAAQQALDSAVKRAQEAERALVDSVARAKADEAARIAAETRAWQVHAANWTGAICGVIALGCIAGAVFLPAAIGKFGRGAAVAGVLCALSFGFARFISSPLLDTIAKWTGIGLAVALVAWVAWEIDSAIKRRSDDKKAGERALVSDTVVAVLDDYYYHLASPEAVADMDAKFWPALQAKGPKYDAAVKRLKADKCDAEVAK